MLLKYFLKVHIRIKKGYLHKKVGNQKRNLLEDLCACVPSIGVNMCKHVVSQYCMFTSHAWESIHGSLNVCWKLHNCLKSNNDPSLWYLWYCFMRIINSFRSLNSTSYSCKQPSRKIHLLLITLFITVFPRNVYIA